MANSNYDFEEIRFDVRDPQVTHAYVLLRAHGDSPIGVQGWHYRGFPARLTVVEILQREVPNAVMWPLQSPDGQAGSAVRG